jgi:hypothetical protein
LVDLNFEQFAGLVNLAIPTYVTALLHEKYSASTPAYYYTYEHVREGAVVTTGATIIGPLFRFNLFSVLATNRSVKIRRPKYSDRKLQTFI